MANQTNVYESLLGVENPFATDMLDLIMAGIPCALTCTREDHRVHLLSRAVATEMTKVALMKNKQPKIGTPTEPYMVVHWDMIDGFRITKLGDSIAEDELIAPAVNEQAQQLGLVGTTPRDPVQALLAIPKLAKLGCSYNAIVIMHDVQHAAASVPAFQSLLKRMVADNMFISPQEGRKFVLFMQSTTAWHPNIEHCVRKLTLPLPDDAGLEYVLQDLHAKSIPDTIKATPELSARMVKACRGLGHADTENTLCLAYAIRSRVKITDRNDLASIEARDNLTMSAIERCKASAIATTTGLSYIPRDQIEDADNICGYEAFMDDVQLRTLAYHPAARAAQIDRPRGFVLVGVPGCGKSAMAKALSKRLDMPLNIWAIEQTLGGLVGQTETNIKDALATIDAQHGVVVMIDEIDKMFVGANGSGAGDSGVSARAFGIILKWLQDRKNDAIVIVTMNSTENIPPEFLRTGRFDAVYGVGLPSALVRKQIIQVHFKKRGVPTDLLPIDDTDWETIIANTDGLLGSDLEEVVKVSRALALSRLVAAGAEIKSMVIPTLEELSQAITNVKQQSIVTLEADRVANTCQWVEKNCRSVAYPETRTSRRQRSRMLQTGNVD